MLITATYQSKCMGEQRTLVLIRQILLAGRTLFARPTMGTYLTFCALCLMLTGCWDKVEIENRSFVSAVGIDAYKDEVENAINFDTPGSLNRFVATAAMPGQGDGDSGTTLTSVADSLMPALAMIRLGTSQEPYYGQTKVIVLGEDLLSDPKLTAQAIDAMERNSEISRKVMILSCEGDASEILQADMEGTQLGIYIADFYADKRTALAVAFKKDLELILRDIRRADSTVIPRVAVNDGVVRLSGAALVNEFELTGWLDDAEVRGLMLAKGAGKNAYITADFGGVRVPLRVASNRARLKFSRDERGLVCTLSVQAKGSVEEYRANSDNDISSPENISHLNALFASAIESEISATHARLAESGVDALGMIDRLRKFNYSLYEEFVIHQGLGFEDITFVPVAEVHVTDVGATR